jgi:phospholipid/cholesterol/gamma-HCH transport system substrate-binding protein
MPGRAQKIRLGIFVLISSIVLISLLAFFTSERYLQKTDMYRIAYEDVSIGGLEVGSPVKYLGLQVGSIKEITIDPENVSRIIVTIAVKEGTPIKQDAHADIVSVGITGLKMIEIRGASKEAELLQAGGQLQAGSTEEITGKAEVVAEKMERVLTNLQTFTQPENLQKIITLIERSTEAIDRVDNILQENRNEIQRTVTVTRRLAARMDSTSLLLQDSAAKIRNIVHSDTLSEILASTHNISLRLRQANLEKLIGDLGGVVQQTSLLLERVNSDVDRGSTHLLTSLQQLDYILRDLNDTSQLVRRDPSVLIRGTRVSNLPDRHLDKE